MSDDSGSLDPMKRLVLHPSHKYSRQREETAASPFSRVLRATPGLSPAFMLYSISTVTRVSNSITWYNKVAGSADLCVDTQQPRSNKPSPNQRSTIFRLLPVLYER